MFTGKEFLASEIWSIEKLIRRKCVRCLGACDWLPTGSEVNNVILPKKTITSFTDLITNIRTYFIYCSMIIRSNYFHATSTSYMKNPLLLQKIRCGVNSQKFSQLVHRYILW
jgi:hypothetical protein